MDRDNNRTQQQPIKSEALSETDPTTRELLHEPDLINIDENNVGLRDTMDTIKVKEKYAIDHPLQDLNFSDKIKIEE